MGLSFGKQAVILALTLLYGCSSDQGKTDQTRDFVGEWYTISDRRLLKMEFFPDGSMQTTGNDIRTGSYTFPDDTHVRLDEEPLRRAVILEYFREGENLIFTNPKGEVSTLSSSMAKVKALVDPKIALSEAKTEMLRLASAVESFYLDTGIIPDNLENLVIEPAGVSGWSGPYVEPNVITDYWGVSYHIEIDRSPSGTTSFEIVYLGVDGKIGGENENADLRY